MGAYLGRKVFLKEESIGFFEEVFCLDDGREIGFYQIVYRGRIYQMSREIGFCLEQALIEIFKDDEHEDVSWESALIGYTLKLKKELFH